MAPLGLIFYTGDNLPHRFRGGGFVGEHGSWDRPTFNGYRVVFVPFSGAPMAKPRMSSPIFLTRMARAQTAGRPRRRQSRGASYRR